MIVAKRENKGRRIIVYQFDLKNRLERGYLDGYSVKKATITDLILGLIKRNPRLKLKTCIIRGDHYFFVKKNKSILSLGRICYRNTPEVVLEDKEASLVSFLTLKQYRGRGMYTALIREMMHYLKMKGFERCIIWTFEDNRPSRKVIENLNFYQV